MLLASILRQVLVRSTTAILFLALFSKVSPSQAPSVQPAPEQAVTALQNNPALLEDFGSLFQRLQTEVRLPAERGQSRLLSQLPDTTVFYAAFPNYGDAAHRALNIFHEQLQRSPALRKWWQSPEVSSAGSNIEGFLNTFSEISQYLGDEVVISGEVSPYLPMPKIRMMAEVRKPGLKLLLQQKLKQVASGGKEVRIFDPRELAVASAGMPGQWGVLVRTDMVLASLDVADLRDFSQAVDSHAAKLSAAPFGLRLSQAYSDHITIVGGIDLQKIPGLLRAGPPQAQESLQRMGFANVKYAVWEHRSSGGQDLSEGELSFTGPRQGAAAWIAEARPLGSLEFVPPRPLLAASVVLNDPAKILDDLTALSPQNPSTFAMLEQSARAIGVDLKQDVLALLTGEVTFVADAVSPEGPRWHVVLGTKDPQHLQQTLARVLAATQLNTRPSSEAGVDYYDLQLRGPTGSTAYAFVGNYLLVGSGDAVRDAARVHGNGGSLAKSAGFMASLPPGRSSSLSGLLYEDPIQMMAFRFKTQYPQISDLLSRSSGNGKPLLVCAYGEPESLREVTTSSVFDPAVVMIGAAIAIPNLLRAKMAANESSAVGTLRTVMTAQIAYSTNYPRRGFAPDLASLGNATGVGDESPRHAKFIDDTIGNPTCTAGAWCEKNGFRFSMTAICAQKKCSDFAVSATPVSPNTGNRNFCATSDGTVRTMTDSPLQSPPSVQECRSWTPIQ